MLFSSFAQVFKAYIKELRSGAVGVNSIWPILSALQADLAKNFPSASIIFTVAEPSPPPADAALPSIPNLRHARAIDTSITIAQSSQMIPVFISLIDDALRTNIIRKEVEQGTKDNRDVAKDAKEALRLENERWEEERKTIVGNARTPEVIVSIL